MQFVGQGRSWAEAEQNAKQQVVEYRLNQEFAQAFSAEATGFLGILLKLVYLALRVALSCLYRPWAGVVAFAATEVFLLFIPQMRGLKFQITPVTQYALADFFHLVIGCGFLGLVIGLLARVPEVRVELPILRALRTVAPAAVLQWLAIAAYAAFGGLVGWQLCRIGWLVPPGPHQNAWTVIPVIVLAMLGARYRMRRIASIR